MKMSIFFFYFCDEIFSIIMRYFRTMVSVINLNTIDKVHCLRQVEALISDMHEILEIELQFHYV